MTPEARRALILDMERTAKLLPSGGASMARRGERERVARLLEDGAREIRRSFEAVT